MLLGMNESEPFPFTDGLVPRKEPDDGTTLQGRSLTRGLEDAAVALAVSLGKRLHHPVDLLGLSRQPEAPQELPV